MFRVWGFLNNDPSQERCILATAHLDVAIRRAERPYRDEMPTQVTNEESDEVVWTADSDAVDIDQ